MQRYKPPMSGRYLCKLILHRLLRLQHRLLFPEVVFKLGPDRGVWIGIFKQSTPDFMGHPVTVRISVEREFDPKLSKGRIISFPRSIPQAVLRAARGAFRDYRTVRNSICTAALAYQPEIADRARECPEFASYIWPVGAEEGDGQNVWHFVIEFEPRTGYGVHVVLEGSNISEVWSGS